MEKRHIVNCRRQIEISNETLIDRGPIKMRKHSAITILALACSSGSLVSISHGGPGNQQAPNQPASQQPASQESTSIPSQALEKKPAIRTVEEMKARAETFMARLQVEQEKIDQQQLDSMLGDRVQLTYMTGVVHGVEITDAIEIHPNRAAEGAQEGSLFVIINLTLNNISLCTQIANFSRTMLIDEDGRAYAIRNKGNDLMTFINMSPSWVLNMAIAQPGVPINTRIAFVVPEEFAHGALSLNLGGPYQSGVNVKLQERAAEDLSAESNPSPPNWPLDMAPWLETRPAWPEVGLNEPTDIGANRYTINTIEFLENVGRKRGTATPESIFLAIDCTIDNLTDEQQEKFKPRLSVVDSQGRMYYPLTNFGTSRRLKISAKGNATARQYYLLPRSAVRDSLDLKIVNRVSFDESHAGWVRLQTSPAI